MITPLLEMDSSKLANDKRTVGPVTTSATLGAALATFFAWAISSTFGIEMPSAVEASLAIIIAGVGSLIGGWLVKPGTGKRVAE